MCCMTLWLHNCVWDDGLILRYQLNNADVYTPSTHNRKCSHDLKTPQHVCPRQGEGRMPIWFVLPLKDVGGQTYQLQRNCTEVDISVSYSLLQTTEVVRGKLVGNEKYLINQKKGSETLQQYTRVYLNHSA